MKEVLGFAFDVVRNISLVIVIVMIIVFLIIINNEKTKDGIITDLYEKEVSFEANQSVSKKNTYGQRSNTAKFSTREQTIKFRAKNGVAYIKPYEITYIQAKPRIVHTIYNQEIILESETKFNDLIREYPALGFSEFYKTKSFIFNSNQMLSINSKSITGANFPAMIFKNGEEERIPKGHTKNLLMKLDSIHNTPSIR